jgi:hypothetical protein
MSLFDFRHGREILERRSAWMEVFDVISGVEADDVLAAQGSFAERGRRVPAGGQSALNKVFRDRLIPLGWMPEPRLFPRAERDLRKWKMDFIKDEVGVEVSFNHAEAIPWTFTRLNIAGESDRVLTESRIDVGIAVFATESLKSWSKMDSAVGTFEIAEAWLKMMKPIMPIPILVVGLDAEGWPSTDAFRGTGKGTRTPSANPEY